MIHKDLLMVALWESERYEKGEDFTWLSLFGLVDYKNKIDWVFNFDEKYNEIIIRKGEDEDKTPLEFYDFNKENEERYLKAIKTFFKENNKSIFEDKENQVSIARLV